MSYDLRHGHCLDLIADLDDDSVDCVISSPPWWGEEYEAPIQDNWGRLGHEPNSHDYCEKLSEVVAAMKPKMKREGIQWWIVADVPGGEMGGLVGIPYQFAHLSPLVWTYTIQWIWQNSEVPKGVPIHGPVPASCPILGLCKDPEYHYWRGEYPDWIACDSPQREANVPWATLPTTLIRQLLECSCPDGGTVVDPFMGSGTVIGMAHALDYYGIGMELNEKSFKGAGRKVKRMRSQANAGRAAVQQERAGMTPKGTSYTDMGKQ